MKSLIKILFVLLALPSLGQENKYTIQMDSTLSGYQRYTPTSLRIGLDLLGPALHFVDNRALSFEGTAEVDFDQFYLVAEGGYQQFKEQNNNVDYEMKGGFLKIGPEANFLHRDRNMNNFSFGLRYGRSFYDETAAGVSDSLNWGQVPLNFDVQNSSWWLEMTTGVKVRLFGNFYSGYILRFRFLRREINSATDFSSYFIPGYGYANQASTWGFRYYILYQFQWKKKPIRSKRKG